MLEQICDVFSLFPLMFPLCLSFLTALIWHLSTAMAKPKWYVCVGRMINKTESSPLLLSLVRVSPLCIISKHRSKEKMQENSGNLEIYFQFNLDRNVCCGICRFLYKIKGKLADVKCYLPYFPWFSESFICILVHW